MWVVVPKPLEGLTRSFNALALIKPLLSLPRQEELTCGCARLRRAQNSHSGRLDFIITVASVPWEVTIARQRSVHRHEHPERNDPMSLARRQTSGPDGATHKPFHLLQVSLRPTWVHHHTGGEETFPLQHNMPQMPPCSIPLLLQSIPGLSRGLRVHLFSTVSKSLCLLPPLESDRRDIHQVLVILISE